MAQFNFGENIMRSIQTQDELNLRNKQMNLDQSRFEQQMANANRAFALNIAKFSAQEQHNKVLEGIAQEGRDIQTSNLDLAKSKFAQDMKDNFIKNFVPYDSVSKDIKGSIPSSAVFTNPTDGQRYVPNNMVSNLEQASTRAETIREHNITAGLGAGNLKERIRHDIVMENKPPATKGQTPDQLYKINYSAAAGALTQVKQLESTGVDLSPEKATGKDYLTYKGKATDAIYKALGNTGITQDTQIPVEVNGKQTTMGLLDYIRQAVDPAKVQDLGINTTEAADYKRQALNDRINSLGSVLTNQQIESLKLWNEIGTR